MLRHPLKLAGGACVYAAGVGVAYELSRPRPPLPTPCERCRTFNALATGYDEEVERDEKTSGILDMRREMVSAAQGRVLEVGAGTGRNLAFYSPKVSDLVVLDYSEAMLKVAASKLASLRTAGQPQHSKVTLAVADAGELPLPDSHFDTVVDTFGLCSFERPEMALREMRRCCKPGGTVLLLEHGESDWRLISWWQQHRLNRHVVRYGCYWNRDIMQLVRSSGLVIKNVERQHMGTTYVLRCERAPDGDAG